MSGLSEPPPGAIVAQRAIIVAASTVEFDSRTLRLASTLAARGHDVTILARSGEGLSSDETRRSVRIRRVSASAADALPLPHLLARRLRRAGRPHRLARRLPLVLTRLARALRVALSARAQSRAARAIATPADVIHAMAFLSLPVAHGVAARAGAPPVVYDARDIYANAANASRLPGIARRGLAWSERRWARRAARVVTVNDAYADVLAQRLGPPRPLVVMNGPSRDALPDVGQRRFHERLGLSPGMRVVLYHGGFSPERGIEQLIDALALLDETAVLVLLGYGVMRDELERRASDPVVDGRLHVLAAVPPEDLLDWVASADVAAMPIQPTTLNHGLTTPNKLFEAMAGGVPVVASDLPGMASIVLETGCGVLCDPTDPAMIAASIRRVLEASAAERSAWRAGGRGAVAGRYSWESQVEGLLREYGRLTGQPW
ncbi:MAG: glycosyltransferase family 4 protein [Chloroflexota bacterium]